MKKLYLLGIMLISASTCCFNEQSKHFFNAIQKNDVKTIRKLLDQKVDYDAPNREGKTALHITQNPEVIHELIIAGANLNQRDKNGATPLFQALLDGNKHKAMVLLFSGADPNILAYGFTPLQWAIKNNDYELVCQLIKAGAKVKPKTITYAKIYGSEKITHFLTQFSRFKGKKIDFSQLDKKGQTIVHRAVLEGDGILVDALCCAGASINCKNKFGKAPIHCAVETNCIQMTQKLLALKAQINIQDNNGETPLHYAAKNGSFILSEMLWQHGSHAGLRDKNGISSFEYIKRNEQLVKLLPLSSSATSKEIVLI